MLEVYLFENPLQSAANQLLLTDELKACGHPLLPNLENLGLISQEFNQVPAHHEMIWMSIFASETLRELFVQVQSPQTSKSYSEFSMLLEAFAERSPNIQSLFIRRSSPYGGLPDLSAIFTYSKPWYTILGAFRRLNSLSLEIECFYSPCLLVLSQLPGLANLEILRQALDHSPLSTSALDDTYLDLPEGSFPALQKLSLSEFLPEHADVVLSIRPLLQNITVLRVAFMLFDSYEEYYDWVTSKFFPYLNSAPCLRDLQIELDGYDSPTGEGTYIGEPTILDILTQLPLKIVKIDHIHFGTGPLGMDLGKIFSNVTILELQTQHASLQELSYFASIPNLCYLEVVLDLTTMYCPTCSNFPLAVARAPLNVIYGASGSKISADNVVVAHNTWYIFHLRVQE